jgi:hypothetical protein
VATCVALLSVFPTVTSAVIRTVNADGSGPYPTIQAAYDACTINDIIELTNGTFTGPGNRELVLHYASVTIRSQSNDPALVILDADGLSLGGVEFNELSIRGIQFRDTDCLSLFFAGVDFIDCIFEQCPKVASVEYGSYSLFHDCVIQNLTDIGMTTHNGAVWAFNCTFAANDVQIASGNSFLFENCEFLENDAGADPLISVGITQGNGHAVFSGCAFLDNSGDDATACVRSLGAELTIEDCIFGRNSGTCVDLIGGHQFSVRPANIRRTTFVDNTGPAAIRASTAPDAEPLTIALTQTIVAFQEGGVAFDCGDLAPPDYPSVSCCDIFGNSAGDYVGCLTGLEGSDDNLSLDPLFCPADLALYTLRSDSPCRPNSPENPTCGLIGASPVGCNTTDVSDDTNDGAHDQSPAAGSRLVASPNPCHGSTTFRWRHPPRELTTDGVGSVAGDVLIVNDAAGRVVRRLSLPRGPSRRGDTTSTLEWDGRDEAGRSVPSGIYYMHMPGTTSWGSRAGSVVVLR